MITLVAALADNRVIGRDGGMPWHLPGDLARFRALTMGHTLVMGRKTFESIGRALPGRHTIVVTRAQAWSADGVTVAHSIDEAIEAAGDTRVFVAGGGEIYAETIDRADRLELTHVHRIVDGDTYFPSIDRGRWRPTATDARDGYTFVRYERVPVADLGELLAAMDPMLRPGAYVFCSVDGDPPDVEPVVVVREDEGTTLVVDAESAARVGLPVGDHYAWITLRVRSALDAVGLTAAVAAALAAEGIACNVVAGLHHDHLFVPVARAEDAIAVLRALRDR